VGGIVYLLFADMCCSSPKIFAVLAVCLSLLAVMQILYYDGQFDDARLNVTLAATAAAAGAAGQLGLQLGLLALQLSNLTAATTRHDVSPWGGGRAGM